MWHIPFEHRMSGFITTAFSSMTVSTSSEPVVDLTEDTLSSLPCKVLTLFFPCCAPAIVFSCAAVNFPETTWYFNTSANLALSFSKPSTVPFGRAANAMCCGARL